MAGVAPTKQMIVPRVGATASTELNSAAAESWQLRVHPPLPIEEAASPYELVRFIDGVAQTDGTRIVETDLRQRLAFLKDERGGKPLLAPHQDSRSQDMLEAAALLEEMWPGRRRAAVQRIFDRG